MVITRFLVVFPLRVFRLGCPDRGGPVAFASTSCIMREIVMYILVFQPIFFLISEYRIFYLLVLELTRQVLVRIVVATEDLRKAVRGVSQAHFFKCDDKAEYLVKFSVAGGDKTVINELVAGTLAQGMNLPVPEIVLVNVPKSIIDNSEDLTKRKISAGLHIGVMRIDAEDFNYFDEERLKKYTLENPNDLHGVLAFDNWVLNIDRNNAGNNMLQVLSKNKVHYHMVDFGHCFHGSQWAAELETRKDMKELMRVFPFFLKHIKDLKEFDGWFNKIEKFSDAEVDSIVASVPSSWNLGEAEKTILVNLIKHRRSLPKVIVTSKKGELGL